MTRTERAIVGSVALRCGEVAYNRSSRVAAAFQVATTAVPGASRRSRTDASLSSAESGCGAARPTRVRLPTTVTETTRTGRWFCADPWRDEPAGASAMSHG